MMGPSQPFRTFTRRFTRESEERAFATSLESSGTSTVDKAFSGSSSSTSGKYNMISRGGKGKRSSSKKNENTTESTYSDSSERTRELSSKMTFAMVTEFTTMPMQTFRLREGGLSLAPYAYYRLRKYWDNLVYVSFFLLSLIFES